MSLENPTRLRIGMRGDFAGRNFIVLGRVVMGVEVNEETYYWNEFNLQAETGERATLVYEDSERGGEWRLFTMFEPESPMTAADAATKQVGDRLNLNGTDVGVTLVTSSRVYRIEGEAPEGVQVGSEANYFNAEAGDVMQVVSWTGQEVEYYNGFTLGRRSVETAFNLPSAAASSMFSRFNKSASLDDSDDQNYFGSGKFLLLAGVAVLVFIFVFGRGCFSSSEMAPVKRTYASSPPLMVGTAGHWGGKSFHITAHAVVEIGEVGAIYERNEYELKDDSGLLAWLVCGERSDSKDWSLYAPSTPLEPLAAQACAAQKVGDAVNIDGINGKVSEIYQYTVKSMDNTAPSGWHQGMVQYGYAAPSDYNLLQVRWNTNGVSYYHGKAILAKDVKDFVAAFSVSN